MNTCLANWANVGTIIIAIFAFVGSWFAAGNLFTMGKKYRYDIMVSLVNQIAERSERNNRAKIYQTFKEGTTAKEIHSWIEAGRKARLSYSDVVRSDIVSIIDGKETIKVVEKPESIDIMNAIEETISCFDKVGFFLYKGGLKLKEEAPLWIWTMSNGLWKRLGAYVVYRQETEDENWGKYFRELAKEAQHHIQKKNNRISATVINE